VGWLPLKLRCAVSILVAAGGLVEPASAALPPGFSDVLVANLTGPTGLAFTPDGRLLISQQSGVVRVYRNGALVPAPALTIPAGSTGRICNNFENGLLGITVDPAFQDNGFVYLYYTAKRPDVVCVNRVSRFTMSGDTLSLASEAVLIDNIPAPNGNHNGGDLKFGKDGYLYVSVGDGGCDWAGGGCQARNDASRDEFVLIGKILRITSDGGIPPDNPFRGQGTARCNVTGMTDPGFRCQETFAWGFRNPFRIAHDPNAVGVRLFINDVGQNTREEIDLAQAGGDYGWNCKEGTRTNSTAPSCQPLPVSLVPPIYEYDHNALVPGTSVSGCGSVTGGAFVPNGLWPGYDGTYLFGDYVCGALFVLRESGGAWSASDFATGLGANSAVTMIFGPHANGQALYYTSYSSGDQVRKIFYDVAGNEPPVASMSASPLSGAPPLTVDFDGSASVDPDAGDTLTYFWDFGDGNPVLETSSATTSHTYTSAGTYIATLRVRDDSFAFSGPDSVVIQPGNTPPMPTIISPAAGATFRVGQTITLTGSATDAQDGTLPASGLSWRVLLNHNGTHTHPLLGPVTGNNVTFTAPAPEDLEATDLSFLEIHLTATDRGGLSAATERNFQPNRVNVTFATSPAGLDLVVNGMTLTGPETVTSWEGWGLDASAPLSQTDGSGTQVFQSWSDGGISSHRIVTPASAATYTAVYQPSVNRGPTDFNTVVPCRLLDTRSAGPALAARSTRTFSAVESCGVPATAKAVAVNLTVIGPGSAGHLRAWAAGTPLTVTSALSFRAGQTRSNNAFVGLGASGSFSVFSDFPTGNAHLAVDVVGWYE
jgi:glucose/arabinose dehydrogenase/PKD repeat protein